MTLANALGGLGILIGLVGIAAAFFFYRRSRQVRSPVWAVETVPSHADSSSESGARDVLATSFVWISNRGTTNIDRNDVIKPLRILPNDSIQLSDATIIHTKSEGAFELRPITPSDPSQGWEVAFENIEPNDYVIIQVTHTGPTISLSGSFKGAAPLRQEKGEVVWRVLAGIGQAHLHLGAKTTALREVPARSTEAGKAAAPPPANFSTAGSRILAGLTPEEQKMIVAARALEISLATSVGDPPDTVTNRIRFALSRAAVFALGEPAGEVSAMPPSGTESDLLHFTIDDDRGSDRVMLPLFSSPDLMLPALQRNPEWLSLSVLQVGGEVLLQNIDLDVNIVVNPWTRLEWEIPAPSQPDHSTS